MLPEYNLNLLVLELLKENDMEGTLKFTADLLEDGVTRGEEEYAFDAIKENIMTTPKAILYKELIERIVIKNKHLSRSRVIATISNIVNNDCDEVNFDYFVLEVYKNAMDEMELLNLNFIMKFRSMFFNGSVLRGLAYIFDHDYKKVNQYIQEKETEYHAYLISYVLSENNHSKWTNNNFSLPTNNMLTPFKEGDGLNPEIIDSFIDNMIYLHFSIDSSNVSDSFISIVDSIIRPLVIEYIEIKYIPNNIIQVIYQKFMRMAESKPSLFNAFVSTEMNLLVGTTLYSFIEHKLLLEKDWIFKNINKGACSLLKINSNVLKMLYERNDIRNMARVLHFMASTGCFEVISFCKYTEIDRDDIPLNVKLYRVMASLQFFGDTDVRKFFMDVETINFHLHRDRHQLSPFNVQFTDNFHSVVVSGIETPIILNKFVGVENYIVDINSHNIRSRINDEDVILILMLIINFKKYSHPGKIKSIGDLIRVVRNENFELNFNMLGSQLSSSYKSVKTHLDSKNDISPEAKCVLELIILGENDLTYRGTEDTQKVISFAKYLTELLLTESLNPITGYLKNVDDIDYALIAFGMYLSSNQFYTNAILQSLCIRYYVKQLPNSKLSKMFYSLIKEKIIDKEEKTIMSDDGVYTSISYYNDSYTRRYSNNKGGSFDINGWCDFLLNRKHVLDLHPITDFINVFSEDELSLSDITHIVKAVDSGDTNYITPSVFKKILGEEWKEHFKLRN